MRPPEYSWTRAKVGEDTRAWIPRPRAMPLTSWVLPAPRSPLKPMTQPVCTAFPHCSPRAKVSSGLCEMSVAMNGQRPHAILVAKPQPRFGGDLADAAQAQLGELLLPSVQQRDSIYAGEAKEELEILAVGQRRQQRRFGGGFTAGP